MRETTGRSRRVSTKLQAALVSVLAIFAFGAFSAASASAAPGDPFEAEFNYVGLNVGVGPLGEVSEVVMKPEDGLGTLGLKGTYGTGNNFTLDQADGLEFPEVTLDLGEGIIIDGAIGLTEDAPGTYDSSTGAMTVHPKISLTLGTDDISALPIIGDMGSGELRCKFSPLDVSLSTNPTNWPAPGQPFEDEENLTDGALAGAWNVSPGVESLVDSNAALCDIISSMLEPVGGLWLANSTDPISEFPEATGDKPEPRPCPAGTTGEPGVPLDQCIPNPVPCELPQTGFKPNCVDPKPPIVVEEKSAEITKVAITPAKGTIKAGKTLKLKIKVTNSGETAGSTNVSVKSNNKKVTVPKTVKISVPAGASATKTITVKASKKAKGKATITAKAASKTATAKLTVKKAKKKK